jgi:hypothetical protein
MGSGKKPRKEKFRLRGRSSAHSAMGEYRFMMGDWWFRIFDFRSSILEAGI